MHFTDSAKRLLIKNPLLVWAMFTYYRTKNGLAATRESERRKNLSLFDYDALCADIPFGPEEQVIDNNLYGQAHHIKKFAGIKTDLNAYLEHGLFFGGMVHTDEYHWYFKKIITFSEKRKEDIERKIPSKVAIPIGPYIHYAEPIYNQLEFEKVKTELGKVLLVFTGHSVVNVNAEFDADLFVAEIEKIKVDYDTVLVSLYYIDAKNPERRKTYENKGYRVVTSGHRYDQNFIARQKTLIQLADMTMSNEVGTHLGNCVCLGKPHYFFQQKLERTSAKKGEISRHDKLFNGDEMALLHEQKAQIADLFSTYTPGEISAAQLQIVDKYWGTSSLKTPEELRRLFVS